MSDVNEMIKKYEEELNKVVSNMEATKVEINRLNTVGVELTAKANVLVGKIEALKELGA